MKALWIGLSAALAIAAVAYPWLILPSYLLFATFPLVFFRNLPHSLT